MSAELDYRTPSVELEVAGTAEADGCRIWVGYVLGSGQRVRAGELYFARADHLALQLFCVALEVGVEHMRGAVRVRIEGVE